MGSVNTIVQARNPFAEVVEYGIVGESIFVAAVIVIALIVSRLLPALARFVLTRLSHRSQSGQPSAWLARVPRVAGETGAQAELRRVQRISAAALMMSRLANVVIWLIAALVVLAGLNVDVVWALSSAGFLGAAIAIGGQHSVHDYLNGLHILLEDRFGEGDHIEVTMSTGLVRAGVVERLGTFSTRLHADGRKWHMSNRLLAEVSNLSQTANEVDLGVSLSMQHPAADVQQAMREALHSVRPDSTTGGVTVDRLQDGTESGSADYRIRARTTAALDTAQHQQLTQEVQRRLRSNDKP